MVKINQNERPSVFNKNKIMPRNLLVPLLVSRALTWILCVFKALGRRGGGGGREKRIEG